MRQIRTRRQELVAILVLYLICTVHYCTLQYSRVQYSTWFVTSLNSLTANSEPRLQCVLYSGCVTRMVTYIATVLVKTRSSIAKLDFAGKQKSEPAYISARTRHCIELRRSGYEARSRPDDSNGRSNSGVRGTFLRLWLVTQLLEGYPPEAHMAARTADTCAIATSIAKRIVEKKGVKAHESGPRPLASLDTNEEHDYFICWTRTIALKVRYFYPKCPTSSWRSGWRAIDSSCGCSRLILALEIHRLETRSQSLAEQAYLLTGLWLIWILTFHIRTTKINNLASIRSTV
jgi:hypothetical protein